MHREKGKFIESPGEKDRNIVESPSEKGQGNIANRVKGQGRNSCMYSNKAQVKG